jgi:hypothetical protein
MESTNKLNTWERFKRYMRKTIKNKIAALLFIGLGVLSLLVSERDVTFLVFTLTFGVPLFFAKENYIEPV